MEAPPISVLVFSTTHYSMRPHKQSYAPTPAVFYEGRGASGVKQHGASVGRRGSGTPEDGRSCRAPPPI